MQQVLPRRRSSALFLVGALVQFWFFSVLSSLNHADAFSVLILLATGGPVIILCLFLFPEQILVAAPLLVLFPLETPWLHLFQWTFLAALLAYALRYLSNHSLNFRWRAIDVAFFVYVLWAACTISQAEDMRAALLGLEPPVVFFLAFWAGSRILGARRLDPLLRIYAWVTIGIGIETAVAAAIQGVPMRLIASELGKFTDLGWGQSNYIAAVAALGAAAVLPAAFTRHHPHRRLARAALASAAFVAFASASRGGTIALLLGLLWGLSLGRLRAWVTLLLMAGGAFLLFFSPFGQEYFLGPKGLPSIGARFLFYREALRIAWSHPVAGVGPDQIPYHTYFYMDINPHNIFLKQAADLGLVGLGLYVVLLSLVAARLVSLYRSGKQDAGHRFRFSILFLVFSTALVNASYEPTLEAPEYGFLFWFLVGVLIPAEAGDGRKT